ncbi:hypothetical protein PDE_06972 [Penicillium oxalicum 114-2]|uniref:Uncharacterized protein n=1 Tax=Penicillium oxalicum (strain 114-2 / CGMCC 5302) TaxID=933388 RepID=S8AZX3_PENO1|nr:hypothetical protein PDE_06972 [Penicillium oxalicum 114-2]
MMLPSEILQDHNLLYLSIFGGLALFLLAAVWNDLSDEIPYRRFPLVGKEWWDFSNKKARERFTHSARALLAEGFAKGFAVFQVIGATNPVIILDPKYIDEIKNHPLLSFQKAAQQSFFNNRIPGFEALHQDHDALILVEAARVKITQALGPLSIPLSTESAKSLKDIIVPSKEWTAYNFFQKSPHIVARVSTLVFMGEKVCRDPAWLEVAVNYTIDTFQAGRDLRMWPSMLRPWVHWFLPSCRKTRQHHAIAKAIVSREIQARAERTQRQLNGKVVSERPNALDWIDELSSAHGIQSDPLKVQLGLSVAAIHTTSNMLTHVMYDLAAYPEYCDPLREEIKAVLAEDGRLQKSTLAKLKLLDSFIKESQRLNPVSITSLNRVATGPVELSDGTKIPRGATIAVSGHINFDESIYPNASTFDGYRFYKLRQEPGHEHHHQLVTTTNKSFDFGHGVHACPGRFFAANEVKIIVIHLLLKYDWTFKDAQAGGRPKSLQIGVEVLANPSVELLFRAREPEIDLAALGE